MPRLAIEPTVLTAWMLVIFYTFQIYFDFRVIPIWLSVSEKCLALNFWKTSTIPILQIRLPISGADGIYPFPRGSRNISISRWAATCNGKLKQFRNIAVVWLLTGVWHGAQWNFILWGCYFGLLLVVEKVVLLGVLKKIPAFFRHLYALFFIVIGWLIFYHTDFASGVACFKALFGGGTVAFATATDVYDLLRLMPLAVICAVASTPVPKRLFYKLEESFSVFRGAVPFLMGGVMLLCIAYMVDSTFSPFLYYIF